MKKFPIYHVDFTLFAGNTVVAGCDRALMTIEEYANHEQMKQSLARMVHGLADLLCDDIGVAINSWTGSINFQRNDAWCLHWQSHYAYNRFRNDVDALTDFIRWLERSKRYDEVTRPENLIVCPCDTCKELNRTMIIHRGDRVCECSSLA